MLHVVPDDEADRHRLVDCPCRPVTRRIRDGAGGWRNALTHRPLDDDDESPLPAELRR